MTDLYNKSVDQRVMFLGFSGLAIMAFFAYKMVEIGQPAIFFISVCSAMLGPVIFMSWILWAFRRTRREARQPTPREVVIGVVLGIGSFIAVSNVIAQSIPEGKTMHHSVFPIVFVVLSVIIEIANSRSKRTQISALNFGIAAAIVKCVATYT